VDATIINAPSSTKNARQERDPEMHQTRKGKQWYFGMKAHVGVDSQTKLIHSVVATAANTADSTMLLHLLHGEETRVWGDQAYRGQTEVLREHAPHAQDFTHQRYRYKDRIDEIEREKNRTKSRVRSKVEHVFGVMKLKFGFVKVRWKRLYRPQRMQPKLSPCHENREPWTAFLSRAGVFPHPARVLIMGDEVRSRSSSLDSHFN
jgi:IS5 family transposase